jgi:hypothetical protein
MAFEAYLIKPYEYPHETDQFQALAEKLRNQYRDAPDLTVLIGNVLFGNNELDAVFLRKDSICVVELKSHGGKITFRENTPWLAGESEVQGGRHGNPFRQVRAYRIGLRNYLQKNQKEICDAHDDVTWIDIPAAVVFARPIEFDAEQLLGTVGYWLHVTDLDRVDSVLASVCSDRTGLREVEIRNLLRIMGIDSRYLYDETAPESNECPVVLEIAPSGPLRVAYHKT